ncbi:Coproporphyrinogen-III oxidase 2, chloroplastic [Capsicum annuum]|uniref:coproporphyrinogen oxidase n=1 Tax=Capsicum annuum TaxID=4072 RepID=A0A2G3ALN4_CAPAN|nr:Coproporphyrinogen-III oxidase 2, chloroplastic [Capsicum annuum]
MLYQSRNKWKHGGWEVGGSEGESNIHTRVFEAKLQDGAVWEKAGVSVSVVYGVMPPEAYRAAIPTDNEDVVKPGPVPFFAAGISSVLHPKKSICTNTAF